MWPKTKPGKGEIVMDRRIRFGSVIAAAVLTLSLSFGSAFGALSKNEQKCINAMNKALSKVAKAQGKENTKCIKNATKGKEPDPDTCLTADAGGKVMKAKTKAGDQFSKKCGALPPIGPQSVTEVTDAAVSETLSLIQDVFGFNLPVTLVGVDKQTGKCIQTASKNYQKIFDTKLKEFVKCKKKALKSGAMTTPELANCLGQDPNNKIAKAVDKLGFQIGKKCDGVNTSAAFPNRCFGLIGDALRDCLDAAVECHVCLAANDADHLSVDCDLFDDNGANGSCGHFN